MAATWRDEARDVKAANDIHTTGQSATTQVAHSTHLQGALVDSSRQSNFSLFCVEVMLLPYLESECSLLLVTCSCVSSAPWVQFLFL